MTARDLRFVNEIVCRLARFIEQLLADDQTRPGDDVVMRMLLSPRAIRRPSAGYQCLPARHPWF
jgi:hypothetical protein